MSKIIEYIRNNGRTITDCPYGIKNKGCSDCIKVGSFGCHMCKYCEYDSGNFVECSYPHAEKNRNIPKEELTNIFKHIVKKCDTIINNKEYKPDDFVQDTVEDIAEICNHVLDGDYGQF